jgi:CRISPR-associated protein Csc3
MVTMVRILNRPPQSLDEKYFSEIRPLLYERHGKHSQWGTRAKHTLAEHLDSACQFVLTVSKMAEVPDDKRAVILAATAVHDLNKLDKSGRSVKTLARDKVFLKDQLDQAGVISLVPSDADLELARRLIERHSAHNASDGALFLPEDPQIKRWASILIAADLFDLELDDDTLKKKLQKELTVALDRPSNLYKIRISENRGYITALLLEACEEVLSEYNLTPLSISPDSELFEGEAFPTVNLTPKIAACWQMKIDNVFGSSLEQLVKPTKDGIKVLPQAVRHDSQEILTIIMARLEKKRAGYNADKTLVDINKWGNDKVEASVLASAGALGLQPVSNADEFALAEGLKAAYLSYRQVKSTSSKQAWDRIASHVGLSPQQRDALEAFDPQYGRPLFAAKAVKGEMLGIQVALMESLQLRSGLTEEESNDDESEDEELTASEELIELTAKMLNLPNSSKLPGFDELNSYIKANPKKRCSLGSTISQIQDVASMPVGIKVQVFSNRLPGGLIAEPRRQSEQTTLLAYQLLAIGASFPAVKPAVKNAPPYYVNLILPEGSSPSLLKIWKECLRELATTNADGGPISVDPSKLYKENAIEFTANKVVGIAFPKRPEFIHNSVILPMVWGEANASVALLKSLRLALELSLSFDFGFPFVLSSSLQVEPSTEFYGRVEGIPTAFSRLLGSGRYSRGEAEVILDRLRCLGNLVQVISKLSNFDDCLYDLARATTKPFSLYYVLLRWVLREQDKPNFESIWQKIDVPLNKLLKSLMPHETTELTKYLKEAASLAAEFNLKGNSFKRTSITEPFTAFLSAIRSIKAHMDLEFVFGSLTQKYHTRLDRIREYEVGKTKHEQIKQYYAVLRKLYEEVYHARPEKLLSDREDLEAAYLFFWQEAYQVVKAKREAEAAAKKANAEAISESNPTDK